MHNLQAAGKSRGRKMGVMNMKKVFCVLLLIGILLSLGGCGSKPQTSQSQPGMQYADPYGGLASDYDALSEAIYNDILGDFTAAYEAAQAVENESQRYAQMAIAEAELLMGAVMLPLGASGGNYAISRMAPNTVSTVLWGNDAERFHTALVTTTPITAEDREVMRTQWANLKGSGNWYSWAKRYLLDAGYTLKDSYSISYVSDPETWDVLATSNAVDGEAIINTYDSLYTYDTENVLRPALAESHTVSADSLTYTFKLRPGLNWVDSQGRPVAQVKADDFVAGMQHMLDAQGGMEYLVQGRILNASEYISGTITDFSQVGVKALDDLTVQYTLQAPVPYFMTMLGYGVFAPMSRSFYVSQGGKFGAEFDASASGYTYGKSPDTIAYCGPYLVSNATAENTIVFKENPAYWNRENVSIKTITWLYNDAQDVMKLYNDMKSGALDSCALTAASLETARRDKISDSSWFDTYGYTVSPTATTFMAFYNLNRTAFSNSSDGAVASTKDTQQRQRTTAAMRNVHFRRAISYALDRGAYNAQKVGEDLKYVSLRNSFTPGTFVTLQEDATVSVGGVPVTFPAGTHYGQIVQAQIDALGGAMQVFDPAAEGGYGSSDGFDGWYNPDAAAAELETAIRELAAAGIEISSKNPIYLDLPYVSSVEHYANRANAYKQSLETVLGGCVIVNLVAAKDMQQWYNAGYFINNGTQANYDVYDSSGWGPDYGDPATYLDALLSEYAGYMTKNLGIW